MIKPTSMIKSIKHDKTNRHDKINQASQSKSFVFHRTSIRFRNWWCTVSTLPRTSTSRQLEEKFFFFSFWSCFWSWSQRPGHFLSRQSSISFFSPKQGASTDSLFDLFIGSSTVLIGEGESSDKFWARSSLSSNEPSAESFTDSPVSLWSRSPAKRSVEKLFESDEVVSPVEDVLTCVIVVLFSTMVVLFSDIFELSCDIVVLFCGIEQFLVLSLIPKPQLWLQLLHWSHSVHAGGIIFFYFFNPFYKKNPGQ